MSADEDSLFSVSGQVVLVTGGSRGIGRAIAEGFCRRGADVVICSQSAQSVETAVQEMQSGGLEVSGLVCDVSREEQIVQTVETVLQSKGRIDTLVNVAGVNRRKRAETVTVEDYDFILDTNLRGAFLMAQAAGRSMIERRSGVVINVESLNTWMPLKGVLPYAMSKFGMQGMTRGLALEWGRHGVRVNSLAPGFILTDLTRKLWSDPGMQAWNEANAPLGRLGQPEDMVGTAIFLASRASAFMTGQTLYVDGGFSSGWSWPIPLS
ncbi:MAG: Gluconate 5-dehydrogenase [Planctomycetota bacterium]|jgi:NAD(P)-dependent dehydrogenase (short-subunit alcohol dehydrogenase family)